MAARVRSKRPKSVSKVSDQKRHPDSVGDPEHFLKSLAEPVRAQHYLDAALRQGAPEMFLVALRNVVDAQGGMSKAAARSKLNRESLYRMLSKRGNPSLASLAALLKGLGFRITVRRDAA